MTARVMDGDMSGFDTVPGDHVRNSRRLVTRL